MKKSITAVLVAMLAMFSVGCAKEEGPMEKMGKQVDEAVEKVEDTAEEVADDVREAAEDD